VDAALTPSCHALLQTCCCCCTPAAAAADTLVAGGGPGGPYNNTLLLVFGDHGQTLGGDHGGGSREETDSTLLAFNIGRMAAATAAGAAVQQQGQEGLGQQQEQQGLGQQQQQQQEEVVPAGGIAQDRVAGGILQLMMQLAGPETDAPTTTHNKAPSGVSNAAAGNPPAADSAAAGSVEHQGHQQVGGGGSRPAPQLLCRHSIPQIDLTPTLALLLGVPIPFGNLGKAPPQLWAVLAQPTGAAGGVYGGNTVNSSSSWGNTEEGRTSSNARDDGSGGSGSDGWDGSSGVVGWLEAYSVALHRNVLQVSTKQDNDGLSGGQEEDCLAPLLMPAAAVPAGSVLRLPCGPSTEVAADTICSLPLFPPLSPPLALLLLPLPLTPLPCPAPPPSPLPVPLTPSGPRLPAALLPCSRPPCRPLRSSRGAVQRGPGGLGQRHPVVTRCRCW
jgi:hypothetical protein